MKEIELTQGKTTLVDNADYEWLNQWKWTAHKCKYTFYADRHILVNGKRYTSQMHREILGFKPYDKKIGDHRNRNGLDNRRDNLREATFSINSHNRGDNRNNTTGYRGVVRKYNGRYQVSIRVNGRRIQGGTFSDIISAAKGYDLITIKYWGDNAILNFPQEAI